MKTTKTKATSWTEKELYDLYQYFGQSKWDIDNESLISIVDEIYCTFQDNPTAFDHNKTLPSKEKLAAMIEKWMMVEVEGDVLRISNAIADHMLAGLNDYALDYQPETPETKLQKVATKLKEIKTAEAQLLSTLSRSEKKHLLSLTNQ